jgi:hypothetical protein
MKRVVTAGVFAVLASTALTIGTAAGQETGGTGTVKGKATLSKKAIPEATVNLKPGEASALEEAPLTGKTNSKGSYKITDVPPGTYKVELTTTVVPKKDRDSGAVGANVDCKIKGYSILSSLIQGPGTDTGSQEAAFVEVEVTQNKPVTVKSGGTKTVNVNIRCPSGITVVGSSS